MESILLFLCLCAIAMTNAMILFILVNKKITLKESFRLCAVAMALNKVLFTGSGYLASSYFSQSKKVSFHEIFASFLIYEFLTVSLWLALGVYYGARIALRIPLSLVAVIVLVFFFVWRKRQKITALSKEAMQSIKEKRTAAIKAIPLAVAGMFLLVLYYFFFFRLFSYHADLFSIIKIIAVSFTVGYFSPAPAGVGFKETGFILLLVDGGLSVPLATSIALIDRIVLTGFWALAGSIFGYDIIKAEIVKRLTKHKKVV